MHFSPKTTKLITTVSFYLYW